MVRRLQGDREVKTSRQGLGTPLVESVGHDTVREREAIVAANKDYHPVVVEKKLGTGFFPRRRKKRLPKAELDRLCRGGSVPRWTAETTVGLATEDQKRVWRPKAGHREAALGSVEQGSRNLATDFSKYSIIRQCFSR
ncbi:hypothetical protein NPIL_215471 [Nephila pilipes]|uniref:Uncharacterized protein n=1 Tax=Nephila pilipes TaxID=299642 RepID=A0A8X6P5H3_NEPPI|nr:hypothetical protein NPIL_215471 [Nephila pilipes]